MLWSSVSKAFDKSRYTLMGFVPLSKCCVILYISSNIASSVECSFLKPYWLQKHSSVVVYLPQSGDRLRRSVTISILNYCFS